MFKGRRHMMFESKQGATFEVGKYYVVSEESSSKIRVRVLSRTDSGTRVKVECVLFDSPRLRQVRVDKDGNEWFQLTEKKFSVSATKLDKAYSDRHEKFVSDNDEEDFEELTEEAALLESVIERHAVEGINSLVDDILEEPTFERHRDSEEAIDDAIENEHRMRISAPVYDEDIIGEDWEEEEIETTPIKVKNMCWENFAFPFREITIDVPAHGALLRESIQQYVVAQAVREGKLKSPWDAHGAKLVDYRIESMDLPDIDWANESGGISSNMF